MTEYNYKQCNRCVMDTTDPDIKFDQNGYCNHCTEFLETTSKLTYRGSISDEQLKNVVSVIKLAGKNSRYDCVLGISGGIDSCYCAYKVKELGLRVLAVHLDNGWDSEPAVKNIKHVIDKLGFDYESYVLNWEEFRELQKAFLRASIPDAEIPTDIAIPAALYKLAAKHKVKYIISGGNFSTEGILPKTWGYYAKDKTLFNYIITHFSKKPIKNPLTFDYKKEIYYKFIKGIKTFYLLNYIPFSKAEAVDTLQKKLEWKYYGGKHYESKYTGFLQSYILPVKFNIDYRKATFSAQICSGDMSRSKALEELKLLPYDPTKVEEEKQYICKKLGFTISEFNEIMKLPPKTYRDFPNDEKKLDWIYGMYRKLKKK